MIANVGWFNARAVSGLCAILFLLPAGDARAADASALWNKVHGECMVHLRAGEGIAPCLSVDVSRGENAGTAILKDQVGIAQVLAIPTRRVTGIEDPFLLWRHAPNYFAKAWSARTFVFAALGRELPRDAVSIAVNSKVHRSQDQLHLHVDCLDRDVRRALSAYAPHIRTAWRVMPEPLKGRRYWVRRVYSSDLSDVAPFRVLARSGGAANMETETLVAVGANFAGTDGFILLADRAEPDSGGQGDDPHGEGGHGEDLQDHDCHVD